MNQNSSDSILTVPAGRMTRPALLTSLAPLTLVTTLFCLACGNGPGMSVSTDIFAPTAPADSTERRALPSPMPTTVLIPDGTVLSVRLLDTLSSRTAQPGQQFTAELAAPVVIHQKLIFPKCARARGCVVSAHKSGQLHEPGYLRLTLNAVQLPDARWIDIRTTSVSAEGRSYKIGKLNFATVEAIAMNR